MQTASADDIERRAASGDVEAQLNLAVRLETQGRGDEAVAWLRRAAEAGDTRGKALLALRLVSFQPLDVVEGAKWARAAATDGNAEATHILALLTAEGLGVPQSWPGALALLERAAVLQHRTAGIELAALSGDWRLARQIAKDGSIEPARCRRLRSSIDLPVLLAVPDAQILSLAPRIAVVDKFISPEMCDWLIDTGRPRMQRAQVVDSQTGKARDDPVRNNSATAIEVGGSDFILALVRARIAAATGLPVSGFEVTAILNYQVGQQFRPHRDYLERDTLGHREDLERNGQRVVTVLAYLNEGFDGGETAFPAINARYKGRKGAALFFWNVTESGAPDPRTLHAGLPPTSGEKWLLSQWIRQRGI